MEEELRDALARRAAGVAVICARDDAGYRAMTATSLASASADPPLIVVGLESLTTTRDAVVGARAFTVSLLSRQQEFLSDRLAGRAPMVDPSWREVPHFSAPSGLPVIQGSIGWFDCALEDVFPAGDHELVLGRVLAAGVGPGDPLILWDRAYWTIS
ncbi:MAG TPA: flavin reductase family protein [Candidatus Dormibacteraeota bacterium]|nr:flavin reductase family protein [Candidatus Dormibacteraeota bacterium]